MLDKLEDLLPIPTGAKMDKWRKNGDTEDREEKKDEVKGGERDKNAQETFSCVMYTDKVSNVVFIMTPSLKPNMTGTNRQQRVAPPPKLHYHSSPLNLSMTAALFTVDSIMFQLQKLCLISMSM